MIVYREIEVCPFCGQQDPWRVYASKMNETPPRKYVKCKRCGAVSTIVYRPKN